LRREAACGAFLLMIEGDSPLQLEKLCDSCAPENRDKVMAEIANMTDSAKKTYDEALSLAKESFEKAKKEALSEYEQSINDLK